MDAFVGNIQLLVLAVDRLALAIIYALAITSLWLYPALSLSDDTRRSRIYNITLLTVLIAAGLELLFRTAALADVGLAQAWPYIFRVIDNSDYGSIWMWRLYIWWFMLLLALWVSITVWTWRSSLLIFVAAITTSQLQSVTGHAGDNGLWSLDNMINTLHLVGISVWGGAVILYATHVLPVLRSQRKSSLTALAAQNLSITAAMALALVVITGTYNSWKQLSHFADLWQTDYGNILLIKLFLVTIMMIIGAMNKFYWVPKIITHATLSDRPNLHLDRLFQRLLLVDSLVFISILLVACLLSTLPPPSHLV